MIAVLRAEWLKLRTTSVPWVLGGIALVVTGLRILIIFVIQVGGPGSGDEVPSTVRQLKDLVGAGFDSYLFAMLLGTLCITTEFRHKTATTAFLVTPVRPVLVAGKILLSAICGVVLAVVIVVATLIGGGLTLVARGGSFNAMLHQVPAVAPGMALVFALFGILGVGIGLLLTNQVAAIVTSLGWFVILEKILVILVPGAFRWVPTGAAVAAANLTRGQGQGFATTFPVFNQWQGTLLMLGYGLLFAAIGSYFLTRRDIT